MGIGYCCKDINREVKSGQYSQAVRDYQLFANETWFTFHNPLLFDPNKFIFLYSHYGLQHNLLQHWISYVDIRKISDVVTPKQYHVQSIKWMHPIRRGVPLQYYKKVICTVFDSSMHLNATAYHQMKALLTLQDSQTALKGKILKEIVHAPYLNQKGFSVLAQLLQVVYKKKNQKFVNKYIYHVLPLFLIFFKEHETYDILSIMIDSSSQMSPQRDSSLHWHLTFTEQQMQKLSTQFYFKVFPFLDSRNKNFPVQRKLSDQLLNRRNNIIPNFSHKKKLSSDEINDATDSSTVENEMVELIYYWDKMGIDRNAVLIQIIEQFFYGYLPFPMILDLFILYLNEGVSILCRAYYALLQRCTHQLLSAQHLNKALIVIKKITLKITPDEWKKVLHQAFQLILTSSVENVNQDSDLFDQAMFMPFVQGEPTIIERSDIEQLWKYIPIKAKGKNLYLKYSFISQNTIIQNISNKLTSCTNLLKMLKIIQNYQKIIIVVQDLNENIFGCYFDQKIKICDQWYGSNNNFVFSLKPKVQKYSFSFENYNIVFTNSNTFKIGGQNSALSLSSNLSQGTSVQSLTFNNKPLSSQQSFFIKKIQIFSLY